MYRIFRCTWAILVTLAMMGALYVSFLISERFNRTPTATVVESTIYAVANIPFPAITLCNNNRIKWTNVNFAQKRHLPNASESTIKAFKILLASMENMEFGSFDDWESNFTEDTMEELNELNITAVLFDVMHRCEDMFIGQCWWRNKFVPCCDIFSVQRSEYGFCYAFNSETNDEASNVQRNGKAWPYRTSKYGDWSGLRLQLNTALNEKPPNSKYTAGFIVMVNHPKGWPNSGYLIPSGTITSIAINPIVSYATDTVRRLTPTQRQCIFKDEASSEAYTLQGTTYLQQNCLSECRQKHSLQLCNCTVDAFFPRNSYPPCKVTDFNCLATQNDIFNNEKAPVDNKYFDEDEEGMYCPCLPECTRTDYGIELTPTPMGGPTYKNTIQVDIHFRYSTMMKYRTDVVFGWLDLMVAFGGIAGLFLGCSLLSGAEILYYLTVGISCHFLTRKKKIGTTPKIIQVKIKSGKINQISNKKRF